MSAITSQPNNINFLSPLGFKFTIDRASNLEYFCQGVDIPEVGLNPLEFTNPFVRVPYGGDKLFYSPLTLRFRVNEDMANYLEIYNWLVQIGYPEEYTQYSLNNQVDATLTILSSHKNPNLQVIFRDIFPISLSGLTFDASPADVDYLEATVTFRYTLFTINKL